MIELYQGLQYDVETSYINMLNSHLYEVIFCSLITIRPSKTTI